VAILEKFNRKAKIDNESGLSTNPYLQGGRFFNNSGNPNMKVRGLTIPFYRPPGGGFFYLLFSPSSVLTCFLPVFIC
jgi:hypothetical protein